METVTDNVLPRGLRNRVMARRALEINTTEIEKLKERITNDVTLSAGNMDLQTASFHLDAAMRSLSRYNNKVNEKLMQKAV